MFVAVQDPDLHSLFSDLGEPLLYLLHVSQERCVRYQDLIEGWSFLRRLSQHPVEGHALVVDVIPDHLGVLTLGGGLQSLPLVVGRVVRIPGVACVESQSLCGHDPRLHFEFYISFCPGFSRGVDP